MLAAVLDQLRTAQNGLKRQLPRHVPRQTKIHARVYQRFYEQEHVSGPARTQSGRHVYHALIVGIDLFAKRPQDAARGVLRSL